MDGVRLADRLAYGAGCAARRVGFLHDAYRPEGKAGPLDPARRFMRLAVAFVLPGGSVGAPAGFAMPFRQAWADWSYLRVGDYLAGPEGIVLVAAIEPPKPMLVVMTNTVVRLTRPAAPVLPGTNPYGAVTPQTELVLADGFPASLLRGGLSDRTHDGMPDDTKVPGYAALLPRVPQVCPQVADVLIDPAGARYVVTGVEQVAGLWRLSLVQAVR